MLTLCFTGGTTPRFQDPHLPEAVMLKFKTYEEPLTLAKRLEVKAIDVETYVPVASLPLTEMASWLRTKGYRWLSGSSGIWERSAAA